jgi:hypothetical protein
MPYKVQKKGDKHCVVVSAGPKKGKEVACHDTRSKAVAQVKALYANDAASLDHPGSNNVPCYDESCARTFLLPRTMFEHALMHATELEEWDDSRKFSADERKKAAKKGQAKSDGSFPIKNAQDLKNAIRLVGNAKNPAAAKAHIIRRAKALGLTKLLPKGWTSTEKAHLDCPQCDRSFLTDEAFCDHAEAVHTFDDIRRILSEHIREEFGRRGDYKAEPIVPAIWTWIDDLSADWVVYCVEEGNDSKLLKASYAITDGKVTLGEPVEVRRRTVFEPVKSD